MLVTVHSMFFSAFRAARMTESEKDWIDMLLLYSDSTGNAPEDFELVFAAVQEVCDRKTVKRFFNGFKESHRHWGLEKSDYFD